MTSRLVCDCPRPVRERAMVLCTFTSGWTEVICTDCGHRWKTRASYVRNLKHADQEYFIDTGGLREVAV